MNYYELLKSWVNVQPEKMLLAIDAQEYRYGDMLQLVDKMQQELNDKLSDKGLQGSMLVLADTVLGQLAAFLAMQAAGLRPILLHHGLEAREVAAILRENQLQGLLTVSEAAGQIDWSIDETDYVDSPHVHPDVLGVLSSGSTGIPKVMYRTYDSWAGFFPVQNRVFHISRETKLFFHGSLSFTGNLNAVLGVLYAGGSLLTSQKFHCHQWGDILTHQQVDVLYLLPTKLQLLTASAKQEWPAVKSVFTGSQLMSQCNIKQVKRAFSGAELIIYYGASELNYITYAICNEDERDSRNLGRPFPGINVSVNDGLIYVDTPYHVSGLQKPFTVQDTGWLNAQGELIFTGRRESWINKGGVKISIQRLENELREIAGVQQVAVVPCPNDLRGSSITAFVVKDMRAEEMVVRRAIRKRLKPVEVPDKITFLAQLPLNDRGKIDRKCLLADAVSGC